MIYIGLALIALVFSFYFLRYLRQYFHYSKYPGVIQFLPKFFPKIPYFNPNGMIRFQEYDIQLRKERPELSDYPFVSHSAFVLQRFIVSDANVVKEIILNSAKDFPKPKDDMEKVFGIYGPNILIENGSKLLGISLTVKKNR